MKKIILYNLNEKRKNEIERILENDYEIKFIDKTYLNEIVGNIFDNKNSDFTKENDIEKLYDNEFMLLDGFDSNEEIGDLLFKFKNNLIKRPITSARTKTNEKWKLKDLLKEIFEEDEYMRKNNK